MKLPGKGFWVGLATGLALAGSWGIYAINVQGKFTHAMNSINLLSVASNFSILRVYLEAGETKRAEQLHRSIAWGLEEQSRYSECLSQTWWLPVVGTLNECDLGIDQPPRDDWEIRHLEMERERFERRQSTGPEPSANGL